MMSIFNGIRKLLNSAKGTFCLILVICASAAAIFGKLDGTGYAACMTTVSVIYCWTQHRTDLKQMELDHSTAERAQP